MLTNLSEKVKYLTHQPRLEICNPKSTFFSILNIPLKKKN